MTTTEQLLDRLKLLNADAHVGQQILCEVYVYVPAVYFFLTVRALKRHCLFLT